MYAFSFFSHLPLLTQAPELHGVPCINFCDIRQIKQCILSNAQRDERREWMKGDQSVCQRALSRLFLFSGCCVCVCVYHQHGWHAAINTGVLWLASPAIWFQLLTCRSKMALNRRTKRPCPVRYGCHVRHLLSVNASVIVRNLTISQSHYKYFKCGLWVLFFSPLEITVRRS